MSDIIDEVSSMARGLWTTLKHLRQPKVTVLYPEHKRAMFPRFKGRHRLLRYEDGLERCIGCSLCAAACPAQAIYVEAAENTDAERYSPGERYAKRYEINMIRCIFCGYCQEACPTEAIVLGHDYELSDYERPDFIYTKERLLVPLPVVAKTVPPAGPGHEPIPAGG